MADFDKLSLSRQAMELRQIRSFVVLAEELHFGRAAARLHLAQPALSQQIKQLEEYLDTPLFIRSSRSVVLSEAGKTFLPRARAALKELREGREELRSVSTGTAGTVRIGFVSTAAIRLIPETLARLRKLFPRIQLNLKEADATVQVEGLLAGDLDIGLMHATALHAALEEHQADTSEVVLALSSKHPLANSTRLSLKDLTADTFILPARTPYRDYHDLIAASFQSLGFEPRQRQEVTMLQTAPPLIAAGAGCALLPDAFAVLKPRGVVFRKLPGVKISLPIYAVVRRDCSARLVRNVLEQVVTNGTSTR